MARPLTEDEIRAEDLRSNIGIANYYRDLKTSYPAKKQIQLDIITKAQGEIAVLDEQFATADAKIAESESVIFRIKNKTDVKKAKTVDNLVDKREKTLSKIERLIADLPEGSASRLELEAVLEKARAHV